MTTLQIRASDLTRAGFSRPAMASSYYPDDGSDSHVHLGVPTQSGKYIAEEGNVFMTFVAIKLNDTNLGNLHKCDDGYFDSSTAPRGTPADFIQALGRLRILTDGCR